MCVEGGDGEVRAVTSYCLSLQLLLTLKLEGSRGLGVASGLGKLLRWSSP